MQICGFFEVDCSISPIINNERGEHIYSLWKLGRADQKVKIENMYYENIALLAYAKSKYRSIPFRLLRWAKQFIPLSFKKIVTKLIAKSNI